mmetsp:Transcript_12690/g.37763  ORF Transcript_12690/g.37763 Transcript_12690/m.37763 type:complete len:212 (-) Transcript_12690:119-754(-)
MVLLHDSEEGKDLLMSTFASWDSSGDNLISKSELKHVLVRLGLRGVDADKLFKAMDANRDGNINYQEFVDFLYKGSAEAVMMDPVVATKSVRQAMVRIQELLEGKKDEAKNDKGKMFSDRDVFECLDLNRNGKLSVSEFIQGLRSFQVNGTKPFTTHEFPTSLLNSVWQELVKAVRSKKKTAQAPGSTAHTITFKQFKQFLNEQVGDVDDP